MPSLGSHLNFNQLEARNAAVHNLSAAPASPVKGQMYFDTVSNTLMWWDGTTWQSAKGGVGAPPDATATVKGVVQLAGDLTGTAAAPAVANGAITSAKIADGTITDVDVAAANKDGSPGTPSMRTLGLGSPYQAIQGTTTLNGISNLNAMTGPIVMNAQKVTGMADPTAVQDAATKNYVDSQGTANLSWKQVCRVTTTVNLAALSGLLTVDGVTLVAGDRVLVKDQGSMPTNGIYIASAGAWTRAPDMATWAQTIGAIIPIGPEGTQYNGTLWFGPNAPGGTLGTTNLQLNVALPSLTGYGSFAGRQGVAIPSTATLNSIANANSTSAAWGNNNWRIVNLADPTAAQDAATKNYVDNTAQGLAAKQPCIIATTANITLSALQTIDGYTTLAGDRVLVKNQTTASQNGIYVAAAGAWARSTDMDSWPEVPSAYVWVEQGAAQGDTGWVCTSDPGGTLNTTSIVWSQFSGSAVITAGAGLTKTGNVIAANPDGTTLDAAGAGTSLEVRAGGIGATQLANGSVDLTGAKVAGILPIGAGGTGRATGAAIPLTIVNQSASAFQATSNTIVLIGFTSPVITLPAAPAAGDIVIIVNELLNTNATVQRSGSQTIDNLGQTVNSIILGPMSYVSYQYSAGGSWVTTSRTAYYTNLATHAAGTTISIPQTTHTLRTRGLHVQVQDNTSGQVELPDIVIDGTGNVTITYAASVAANSKLVTLVG